MVEYVNMIMKNEYIQGQQEVFTTWKPALEKAIFVAENMVVNKKDVKRYQVEVWEHDIETDKMRLYEIIPFVRTWYVEIKTGTPKYKDFKLTEAMKAMGGIKARTAKDAAKEVMSWFDTRNLTEGVTFKVYPVDEWGRKIQWVEIVIFGKGYLSR